MRSSVRVLLIVLLAGATACAEDLMAGGDAAPRPDGGGGGGGDGGGTAAFTPSNVDEARLTAGGAALTLSGSVTIDTDTGTITDGTGGDLLPAGVVFATETQTDAPGLAIFSATDITIESGANVDVRGGNALVLLASGDVTIDGTLDLRGGKGNLGQAGPGGFGGGVLATPTGEGPGGGGANLPDVGGGGAGHFAG